MCNITIKLDVPAQSVQFIMIEGGNSLPYVTSVVSELKDELGLTNYPNPFPDLTTIQFQTSSKAGVILDVFNHAGKKISTLINKELPSGTHQVDFNGNSLPAGLYFYQLKVGNYSTIRKMILEK